MTTSLDISASGLYACRRWMNVIANNTANAETITDANGNYSPYHKRFVLMAPGATAGSSEGVRVHRVEEDFKEPMQERYEPNSPYADKRGMVAYPNVQIQKEVTDMLVAKQLYEANLQALVTTKSINQENLRLLA